MALSKQNVTKAVEAINQNREAKFAALYSTYEQKIDRRLLVGERQFIFQIDSTVALEAMRKLVGNYRKGSWNVEVTPRYARNIAPLSITGVWVLKFE